MLHYFPLHCYQNNLSRRWSISSRFGAAFLADQRWFWKKLAASSVPTYPTPAVYQKVQPLFAPAWSTYMVSAPVPPWLQCSFLFQGYLLMEAAGCQSQIFRSVYISNLCSCPQIAKFPSLEGQDTGISP